MKSRPPIQIFARCLAGIQWMCPVCSYLHNTKQIDWRQAAVRCGKCKHRFRFGLQINTSSIYLPPYNALFLGNWDGYTVNRLGDVEGKPAIGRPNGSIQFQCPACQTISGSLKPSWDFGVIVCPTCTCEYYLSLLLWQPNHGNLRTPIDWIYPKHGKSPKESALKPPCNAAVGEIPGETGCGA